jgi:hypothetical protein
VHYLSVREQLICAAGEQIFVNFSTRPHLVSLALPCPATKQGRKKKKKKSQGRAKNRGQGQPQQKDSKKTGKEKRLEEKAAASRTTRKISL